jgi:hypothetical protein
MLIVQARPLKSGAPYDCFVAKASQNIASGKVEKLELSDNERVLRGIENNRFGNF